MRKRLRVWRVGKWAGSTILLLLIAAWAGSVPPTRGSVKYEVWRPSFCLETGLVNGLLYIGYMDRGLPTPRNQWTLERAPLVASSRWWHRAGIAFPTAYQMPIRSGGLNFFAPWSKPTPLGPVISTVHMVVIPLWLPTAFVGALTALLWRRDRRRVPLGRCEWCGYDLTKNESGRCPECGVGISAPRSVVNTPTCSPRRADMSPVVDSRNGPGMRDCG